FSKIEHGIAFNHQPETLMQRLVKTKLMLKLCDKFRIKPLCATIFAGHGGGFKMPVGIITRPEILPCGRTTNARRCFRGCSLDFCGQPATRPAGRKLDDCKVKDHNPKRWRNNQEQTS